LLDCPMDPNYIIGFMTPTFSPVADNYLIMDDPKKILASGNFKKTEVMVGNNLNEMNYFIALLVPDYFPIDQIRTKSEFLTTDDLFDKAALFMIQPELKKIPAVRDAILFEYKDWTVPANASGRQAALDRMIGDFTFTCSSIEFSDLYAAKGTPNVYYYYFKRFSSQQTWPRWMGVMHGYEIEFVFGEPLNTKDWHYTEEEKDLTKRFMRYWANFARTGDPNINQDGTKTPNPWPKYSDNQAYIDLDVGAGSTGTGFNRRRCQFWQHYIPNLIASSLAAGDVSQAEKDWKTQYDTWQSQYKAFQLLHPRSVRAV